MAKAKRLKTEKIRLSRQGYDKHGKYYGVGEPLFRVYDDDYAVDKIVRAANASDAIAIVSFKTK